MLIQCTKKLLQEFAIEPETVEYPQPFFAWHAHIIELSDCSPALLLANDLTRYVVVVLDLEEKNDRTLDDLISDAIKHAFLEEGISEDVIELYLERAGSPAYSTSSSRSLLARLNSAGSDLHFYLRLHREARFFQGKASKISNRRTVKFGPDDRRKPGRVLPMELIRLAGKEVVSTPAVQLKVSLDLDDLCAWRRLVVPVRLSFSELHTVLQVAFGWQDCHLHAFYGYDHHTRISKDHRNHPAYHKDRYRPLVEIVSEYEESVMSDLIVGYDYQLVLSDYWRGIKHFKYLYDYGDNWEHYLEVEKIIPAYNKNYPHCFDWEGETPPEDVGGTIGYFNFLDTVADPQHPECETLKAWADSQGYSPFNLADVNDGFRRRFM